ncbi:MAG: hypothetical protein IJ313_01305 [Clostridia bacterium]|nr:hypothetical protein [Clostridia bacterium]
MANVQEIKMAEMEKEKAYLSDLRRAEQEVNAKLRARVEELEGRNRRLEACIVNMMLESYTEEH